MNYPVWGLPAPGLLVAAVAILHVFISHFAVGGGLFLVLAESKARREGDEAFLGFVRELSRGFILLTLVLGALTGVGIWFTIGLVQPQATSALVTTFVWAWAIEWTFFATEIAAAMVYYYGWDRLDAKTHLTVGWIYFASAWAEPGRDRRDPRLHAHLRATGCGRAASRTASSTRPTCRWWRCAPRSRSASPASTSSSPPPSWRTLDLKARIARWSATRWIAPAAVARPARAAVVPVGGGRRRGRGGRDARREVGLARRRPDRECSAATVRAPDRARRGTRGGGGDGASRRRLARRGRSPGPPLRPHRGGAPRGPRLRVDGRQRVGARGAAQALGDRSPHVRERRAGCREPGAAPAEDPFALDALDRRGVLATSPWAVAPAAYRPGDPTFERMPAAERAALEAEAGREVFRIECAACHTERGHLGVRRLVQGKSVAAITAVLDATARPVAADGRPGSWSDPGVHVASWLGRRMPPFAGTGAEKRALAVHLARLGGDESAGLDDPAATTGGAEVFERYCAACHGSDAPWPITDRLRGRAAGDFYELIGRLSQVREEMPPFAGSDDERRALAQHLASLAATAPSDAQAGGDSSAEEEKP